MSRTNREPFDWIKWLDGFDQRIKRDGVKREAPTHKKTASNMGYPSEGYRKRNAKKKFKHRRNKDDRLERKLEDVKELKEDND